MVINYPTKAPGGAHSIYTIPQVNRVTVPANQRPEKRVESADGAGVPYEPQLSRKSECAIGKHKKSIDAVATD
jgi:hypothetical protein